MCHSRRADTLGNEHHVLVQAGPQRLKDGDDSEIGGSHQVGLGYQVVVGNQGAPIPGAIAFARRAEGIQRGADCAVTDRVHVQLEAQCIKSCGRFP